MKALCRWVRKPAFDIARVGSWWWREVAQERGGRVVCGEGRGGPPPFDTLSGTRSVDERCGGKNAYYNYSISAAAHWSWEGGRAQRLNRVLKPHLEI